MIGVIAAGGLASRFYPSSQGISKHLFPVYDKPAIYYPIANLMQFGIREIFIVVKPQDLDSFEKLIKNGSQWGLDIKFRVQIQPNGVADVLDVIGKEVDDQILLILGDNFIVEDNTLIESIKLISKPDKAHIFGKKVTHPEKYGVVSLDKNSKIIQLEEKPKKPTSNIIAIGLYIYPKNVFKAVKNLKNENVLKNELEITALNINYLNNNCLTFHELSKKNFWVDMGTPDGLSQAARYVKIKQIQEKKYIACLEEIAFQKKWISYDTLTAQYIKMPKSNYSEHIRYILKHKLT